MLTRLASTTTLLASLASVVTAASLGGCVIQDNSGFSDSSLTVTNQSSFDIKELYITFTGDRSWGPNVLGAQPLLPGDAVLLDSIACDTYDTLIVDETGAQCEVDGISLCFDDADWVITNHTCNVFTAAPAGAGSPSTTPRTFPTTSTQK